MSGDTVFLRDEEALLVASIEDARAEHARGDLSDDALEALVGRDTARLGEVRARLADLGAVAEPAEHTKPAEDRGLVPRRRLLLIGAVSLALAVAAGVLAATDPFASAPRPPRITTPVTLIGLCAAAERSVASGSLPPALTAYDSVLRLDPSGTVAGLRSCYDEAFIESGWLRYELGLEEHRPTWVRAGARTLAAAVSVAPGDAAAHLYDGIVLYQYDKDRGAARVQLLVAGSLPESQNEQSITGTFLALVDPATR